WLRAYDGLGWSAWKEFHVTAPVDHPPVVTAANQTISKNSIIVVTGLFAVIDPDQGDTLQKYQLWDGTADPTSGFFSVDGVAQVVNQTIEVTAANLASTTFQAGQDGTDDLFIRASDGALWSDWTKFQVTASNHAPVVTASDITGTKGQNFAATTLFAVS